MCYEALGKIGPRRGVYVISTCEGLAGDLATVDPDTEPMPQADPAKTIKIDRMLNIMEILNQSYC